jgi:hypothetical protein
MIERQNYLKTRKHLTYLQEVEPGIPGSLPFLFAASTSLGRGERF